MTDVKKDSDLLLEMGEDQNPVGVETRPKVEEVIVPGEKRELSPEQQTELLNTLEARFNSTPKHYERLEGVNFEEVKTALEASPKLMWSLAQMENTGGEPDIIAIESDVFVFGDCSAESPNRRDLNYYQASEMAKELGVDMMSEELYYAMRELGKFDTMDTWSWLKTPYADIKDLRNGNIRALAKNAYFDDELETESVGDILTITNDSDGGWRGVLRVPKV